RYAPRGSCSASSGYHFPRIVRREHSDDPQPVVHIVHVRQSIPHHHAPCHGSVSDAAVHVRCIHVNHLALLRAQVTPQLTRDVECTKARVVCTHVQCVPRHPDVVHSTVLRLVPGNRARVFHVRHVHHVQPSVCPSRGSILRAPHRGGRKDLIGDEYVVVVPPGGVRSANEARAALGFHL